jgi:predicted N-acetyltransferase YhbS
MVPEMMDGISVERCVDSALSEADSAELRDLLHEAFGDYFVDRIFFKQIPHERVLLRSEAGIVGQCGLDHRVMRADDGFIYTLGVVDLCVREELRGRRLGERLMREILAIGRTRKVDHVVLLAKDGRLYRKLGFSPLTARVTWLGIEDLHSVAVLTETMTDDLYTLPIRAPHRLKVRHLDFLGYMF